MPIRDFYNCQRKLNRHFNCGILSVYLDSFTDWLGRQGYPIDSVWRHVSRVSHFSHYLKRFKSVELKEINDYVDGFLYHHLPECKCTGWAPTDNGKAVLYSINRFKNTCPIVSESILQLRRLPLRRFTRSIFVGLSKRDTWRRVPLLPAVAV